MTEFIVTGSAGFIGKNLLNRLKTQGREFIEIDDPIDLRRVDDGSIYPSSVHTVIHLAAETNVRNSIEYPRQVFVNNCVMTANALEIARRCDAKFVFASSCGAPESASPYSASKLAGEALCRAYKSSYGLDIHILRFSNVYGPHSLHKESIIAKLIKSALDNMPIQVFGDGLQTRDFIHVDDIVYSLLYPPEPEVSNIAYGQSCSINELVEEIHRLSYMFLNYEPVVRFLPPIEGEIRRIEIPSSIVPKVEFMKGINETFRWFMENY